MSADPGQTTAMAWLPADFIHPTRVPVRDGLARPRHIGRDLSCAGWLALPDM